MKGTEKKRADDVVMSQGMEEVIGAIDLHPWLFLHLSYIC
jgi:hypothetical protein